MFYVLLLFSLMAKTLKSNNNKNNNITNAGQNYTLTNFVNKNLIGNKVANSRESIVLNSLDDECSSLVSHDTSIVTPLANTSNLSTANCITSSDTTLRSAHPTYRNTVAEYCNNSFRQQQPHSSWRQTPPPHSLSHLSQSSPANTLTSKFSILKDFDIVESSSAVVFRNVNSGIKSPPTVSGTTDTQSISSSNVDSFVNYGTLGQRTHKLSSSLILTPSAPIYCNLISDLNTKRLTGAELSGNAFLMSTLPASNNISTNSGGIASSSTAALLQFCCECCSTQNRCSTDSCPCYALRRMCDEHCESARYRGDCLNQAICKCSCEVDPTKPAKNVCTKSERCDCLRIKEGCSKLCVCKQVCKNKEPPKRIQKIVKPTQGCQCAKSKKQCVKKECQCRSVYEFCSINCKCAGDCSNGASKFHVPKHVQNCFLEHKNESSGLIVTLIGNDYIYRGNFYHESKNDLHVEEQLVAAIYDLISKYKV